MITLTESAQKRIAKLIEADPRQDLFFRFAVEAGGCSGFSYKFELDNQIENGDLTWEMDEGFVLVTDPMSIAFLKGSTLDWVEDIMGASFKVTNPLAVASCGCGTSFGL